LISRSVPGEANTGYLSDGELWELFKSGDKNAFHTIYESHADALYNYGMNFSGDNILVRECIQDLFVEIWNRKDYLGRTDNIRYYLLKSLRRRIFAGTREQKKWLFDGYGEKFSIISLLNRRSLEIFNENEYSGSDIRKKLSSAIEILPLRQKEALFQIYFEKLSYEEAASVMDVNIKTVYNLVWRGIEKLRRDLRAS
jgi:RNA polymerase sigma factor (sigma-70 family)